MFLNVLSLDKTVTLLRPISTSATPTTKYCHGEYDMDTFIASFCLLSLNKTVTNMALKLKSTSPTPTTRFRRGVSSKPKSTYPTPHHEMSSWLHHHMHGMLLQAAGEKVLASFCL